MKIIYQYPKSVLYLFLVLFIIMAPGNDVKANCYQELYTLPADTIQLRGETFSLSVMYNVSDGYTALAGVGIRIHYDSDKLEYFRSENVMAFGLLSTPLEKDDINNSDSDSKTDRMIIFCWADMDSNRDVRWPNEPLPIKLVDIFFKVSNDTLESSSSINFSFISYDHICAIRSSSATIQITTDPTVTWTTPSISITEEAGSVDITAQLSFDVHSDIYIPLSFTGTADINIDYTYSSQFLVIPYGSRTGKKTITIIDDELIEEDETIVLTMGKPNDARLGYPQEITIFIRNQDNGHFPQPNQTNNVVTFWGDDFIINGKPAQPGDEIGVYDPDGILCGRYIFDDEPYFSVSVFGDDNSTIHIDEGAVNDNFLTFKVWDVINRVETTCTKNMFFPMNIYHHPASPHNPPKWTKHNDHWGLNIHVYVIDECDPSRGSIDGGASFFLKSEYLTQEPTIISVNNIFIIDNVNLVFGKTNELNLQYNFTDELVCKTPPNTVGPVTIFIDDVDISDVCPYTYYNEKMEYSMTSDSHQVSTPSNNTTIKISWQADSNDENIGYYYFLNNTQRILINPLNSENFKFTSSSTYITEPLSDQSYYFHIAAKYDEGIIGQTFSSGPYIIDTQAPEIKNIYTSTTQIREYIDISLTVSDADEMCISNVGYTTCSWEPYTSTLEWKLSEGDGSKTLYFQFRDTAQNTVTDTVSFDYFCNDPPDFTSINPTLSVEEDCALYNKSWANNISAGQDENHQKLEFILNLESIAKTLAFQITPTISEDGELSFKPASNSYGKAIYQVILQDDGGNKNGGIDQSGPIALTIFVKPVNDHPVAYSQSVTLYECEPKSITLQANDIDDTELLFTIKDGYEVFVNQETGIIENLTICSGPSKNYTFSYFVNDRNNSVSNDAVVTIQYKKLIIVSSNEQSFSTLKEWIWHSSKPDCLFRYSIDKNESGKPSGEFSSITSATLQKQYGLYYIHIQAKDADGNLSKIVSERNIDIDNTPPTILNLNDDPTPKQSIRWNWSSDKNCLFSFCVDQDGSCEPAEEFKKITTTELKHGDGKWYLHVKAVDLKGNISSKKVCALLDNTPPDITIFQKENDQKTWHWSSGNETNCTFRHTINQNDSWTASGNFNAITSVTFDGYTLCYLHIQAEDQAGNRSDVTSIKISDPLPDRIKVSSKTTGMFIQLEDKMGSNNVKSYIIYRSQYKDGPYIEIDPIIFDRFSINDILYYRIFDDLSGLDIARNSTYWYKISAIMPDGTTSRLSEPVESQLISNYDNFYLIPLQKERYNKQGQSVIFNIQVIPEGNFQSNVNLSLTYPETSLNENINDFVTPSFSNNTVIPFKSVDLKINYSFNSKPGTYAFDVNAIVDNGPHKSIRMHFSIIPFGPEGSFISTSVKYPQNRIKDYLENNDSFDIRMNEPVDIYGSIIPERSVNVNIFVKNEFENEPTSITTVTNSEGNYLVRFKPKNIGIYTVDAQYINLDNQVIQSNQTKFTARKSNQSKILFDTSGQQIELNGIVTIYSQLIPKLDQIPVYYQIKKSNEMYEYTTTTKENGKFSVNLKLDVAGVWEIIAWWEGNDFYEGQFSQPLYLYPGIDPPRALIIAGGGNENNSLWKITQYLTNYFYDLLIDRRLDDNLIYYMSSGEKTDRTDEIDLTQEKIQAHLRSLYEGEQPYKVNEKIPLIIYLSDHGGKETFQLDTNENIKAYTLNHYLDELQEKTQCEVQIIIDSCYSGSFIDDLNNGKNRIIITSTGEAHPSYNAQDGRVSFSYYLIHWLFQGFSLGDSFSHAQSMLDKSYFFPNQIPKVNNIELASKTYIGGDFIKSNTIPVIIDHTPNQIIKENSLTIHANVIDLEDTLCDVWASILPPNHKIPSFGEFISPQWQLERIDLIKIPGEENVYAGTYDCFYQKGIYVVYLYASDSIGNIDSKEIYLTVKQDHIPQNWGDIDGNRMIDLNDAIIGLQILSGVPYEITLDCKHRLSFEEILYSLKNMAELK